LAAVGNENGGDLFHDLNLTDYRVAVQKSPVEGLKTAVSAPTSGPAAARPGGPAQAGRTTGGAAPGLSRGIRRRPAHGTNARGGDLRRLRGIGRNYSGLMPASRFSRVHCTSISSMKAANCAGD